MTNVTRLCSQCIKNDLNLKDKYIYDLVNTQEPDRTRRSAALDHGATQVGNEGVHIPFEAM